MQGQHVGQQNGTHSDVLIIGAGLAGLATADRLASHGRTSTILEASDRIGGRTYGWFWDEAGRDVDLGGTWLLPGFATAFALIDELRLDTYDSPASEVWLTHLTEGVRTRRRLTAEEEQHLAAVTGEIGELREREEVTASDALAAIEMPAVLRDWHVATQRYLAGAPVDALDAAHLLIEHDDLVNPEHYATQITGTTRSLATALVERSGVEVLYDHPVIAVRRAASGWVVETRDGDRFTAGEVVVAAPRNVLAGIEFDPTPTGALAELIGSPHVGACRKDWFILDGVEEHFRVFGSEGPFGYFRSEEKLPDGGMLAVGLAPQAEGRPSVSDLEQGIRQYLPESRIRAHFRHDWVEYPWARGTWFAPRPGDFERNTIAVSPDPTLQFVGGDFCTEFPATIEGALRTGVNAAERIRTR